MPRDGRPRLTQKQRRFVAEYAADGNAVQAYFRAYGRYTSKGRLRTYKSAQAASSRLLSIGILSADLAAANAEYAARVGVDKERALRELAAIAFADPADVYAADPGNGGLPAPRPWDDIPPAARRAVAAVKVKRRRLRDKADATEWELEEVEYKFHSKTDALDKLCKKLGLYAEEEKPGDDPGGRSVEFLARLAALAAARQPQPGGPGGGPG